MRRRQLLLLEDVDGCGRKGDIVSVKTGFARNYLIPTEKGIVAEPHLVRLQDKLKEDRAKQAIVDKKDAEALAARLEGAVLRSVVKIDAEGHMYGSVTAQEIVQLFADELKIVLEKRNVAISKPIKTVGVHEIPLQLKEGVKGKVVLEIVPETAARL